jgi:hypothetical protein
VIGQGSAPRLAMNKVVLLPWATLFDLLMDSIMAFAANSPTFHHIATCSLPPENFGPLAQKSSPPQAQ